MMRGRSVQVALRRVAPARRLMRCVGAHRGLATDKPPGPMDEPVVAGLAPPSDPWMPPDGHPEKNLPPRSGHDAGGESGIHELRHNLATDEWVVFSEARRRRPIQYQEFQSSQPTSTLPAHDPNCPFCKGNEDKTPPATLCEVDPVTLDWTMRVVPNKYPAVSAAVSAAAADERGPSPSHVSASAVQSQGPEPCPLLRL